MPSRSAKTPSTALLDNDAARLVDDALRLVDDAARLLAAAGEVDPACRLAARGWWLAETHAPRAAQRLNATLHHLTRVYEKGQQ